ncbi:hypothetical protein KFK09_012071 [Dendrobium nobile]|uniref:Uncharacterized protein n=1 Tax=Dendrobium nobile TaxID=94219 RepID=A0A8T3BHR8_DENNO|nr:hypothetical protein KFK09_012071 [Dendrobium nobile]
MRLGGIGIKFLDLYFLFTIIKYFVVPPYSPLTSLCFFHILALSFSITILAYTTIILTVAPLQLHQVEAINHNHKKITKCFLSFNFTQPVTAFLHFSLSWLNFLSFLVFLWPIASTFSNS